MNVLAASGDTGRAIFGIILWVALIAAYWIPTITAKVRRAPDIGSVAVWNFFGFFFLVPWIVAMAKAMRDPRPAP